MADLSQLLSTHVTSHRAAKRFAVRLRRFVLRDKKFLPDTDLENLYTMMHTICICDFRGYPGLNNDAYSAQHNDYDRVQHQSGLVRALMAIRKRSRYQKAVARSIFSAVIFLRHMHDSTKCTDIVHHIFTYCFARKTPLALARTSL